MTPGRKLVLLVERMSGIVLPDHELQRLTDWAARRAVSRGFDSTNAYVEALRRHPENDEWRILLSRVTVQESSLFRAPQQFRCLTDRIIPELVEGGKRSIRIWSAGCARGEEPATLGVVLQEALGGTSVQWSVLGTDVDDDALEWAREGRFSEKSVRRVPTESLHRHFSLRDGSYVLNGGIRSHLRYVTLNLVEDPLVVPGQPFDVIFLRNVLIYFRRELQVNVVRRIQGALASGGFLFVGPSESLMQLAPTMRAEDRSGVFVYRERTLDDLEVGGKTSQGDEHPPAGGDQQPEAPRDFEALALEGENAELRGDLRTALRCYRGALYLEPDYYQIRYRLGCCLEAVGWARRAQAEFRAVVDILNRGSGKTFVSDGGTHFPARFEIEMACDERIQAEPLSME